MYHPADGSWYRKWSDGWLEQGGHIPYSKFSTAAYHNCTFTLLKAFANTNYIFVPSVVSKGFNSCDGIATVNSKTTTSINIYLLETIQTNSEYVGVDWYACGKA